MTDIIDNPTVLRTPIYARSLLKVMYGDVVQAKDTNYLNGGLGKVTSSETDAQGRLWVWVFWKNNQRETRELAGNLQIANRPRGRTP